MTIGEIFELTPDSVVVLENAGVNCTGCKTRTDRTLSEILKEQSVDETKEQKILAHLNKLKQLENHYPLPEEKDMASVVIKEGNKTYYKIAGVMITESAYQNLHNLATKRGLRIKLTTGGCSGFKYEYDFFDEPQEKERTYQLSEQLAIFMDDFTFGRTFDSIIEFKLGLHDSGLQIINPNKKRACSCGTSIAF